MYQKISFEETNFNIMFGILSNDFIIEDVDIKGYLEWIVEIERNDYTVHPPKRSWT